MNISIVIPTLNEKDNLPKCLGKLEGQVEEEDEVIIVDGGSSDGTIDIALESGARVIKAEGSGIGQARNIGAKVSDNSIIATTDADARPPREWLERIREHFEKEDELAVLWGDIRDTNGVPIRNLVGKFSTPIGGASGNNTAFRKRYFNKLDEGYPDADFVGDTAIIYKLATVGNVKRDKNLVMRMNMDRTRYQTQPILIAGTISMLAGDYLGGKVGDIAVGAGTSLMGTELTYENFTGSPIHHDELGSGLLAFARYTGSDILTGAGVGTITHHVVTEGVSALPTELEKNTNKVIESVRR
jgi:glycosyltransferase involved in cell wall biosynthesis